MSTGYGRPNGIAMTMSEDKETIPYRKKLNKITGKVTATILLQQAMYWDIKKDGKFFKFIAPCTHDWYKENDSWLEELGFTRSEFNTAIKKIGYKRGKNKNKIENEEDAYVIYYTDSDRVTYWFINWEKLNYDLLKVYHPDLIGKSRITKSKGNDELLRDKEKQDYPITESTTETTTENKPNGDDEAFNKQANKVVFDIWEYYKLAVEDYFQPRKLTSKRRGKIRDMLEDFSVDEIKQAIDNIAANNFMTGQVDGNFKATIMYLFQFENMEKWIANCKVDNQMEEIDYYADLP